MWFLLACAAPSTDTAAGTPPDTSPDTAGDTAPDAAPPAEQPGLYLGEAIPCADPDARSRDGALYEPDVGADWLHQAVDGEETVRGPGVVVADLDGDGRRDLLLTAPTSCLVYMARADGTYVEEGAARLPELVGACSAWGASAADADGDGDIDVLLARDAEAPALLRNDGAGVFAVELLDVAGGAARSASWGDLDGDGDLDLAIASQQPSGERRDPYTVDGERNALLLNRGDATFAAGPSLPVAVTDGYSFLTAWVDLDGDQDLDLYVINDFGYAAWPNVALDNDGGVLTSLAGTGLELAVDGMSLGVGDLDGDGLPELVVSDRAALHLLTRADTGGWYDVAVARGLTLAGDRNASWGLELADLDNDGDLDLPVAFGAAGESEVRGEAAGLWVQDTSGQFEEQSVAWGLDVSLNARGMVVTDLDGDGWLDLVITDFRGERARLFRSRCGAAHWVEVRLDGETPNTAAVGARVRLRTAAGWQTRWIAAGSTSMASSGPAVAHFGLADADTVAELVVDWPGGGRSRWTGVPADRVVTLVQAESLPTTGTPD